MNDRSQRKNIRTEAGFGPPVRRPRLDRLVREMPNFIKKNRGLTANPDFWRMLGRLVATRLRPCPLPADGPILFVATHHKVMTTYFHATLRLLCFGLRIPFDKVRVGRPASTARLFLSMHSKIDLRGLGGYRGVHVMRDPRDMIVSSYHYHKWTHEDWVHRPDENGVSYQEKLNQADRRTGLFMEIDHFIFFYRETLAQWDTSNRDILEVAYEDLTGPDRREIYRRMFDHLGFAGRELALAVDLMQLFEAGSRTGRKDGSTSMNSHIRSGRTGQWKDELDADHVAYIERELGPILRKFGY